MKIVVNKIVDKIENGSLENGYYFFIFHCLQNDNEADIF